MVPKSADSAAGRPKWQDGDTVELIIFHVYKFVSA